MQVPDKGEMSKQIVGMHHDDEVELKEDDIVIDVGVLGYFFILHQAHNIFSFFVGCKIQLRNEGGKSH